MAEGGQVAITLNGRELESIAGRLLIDAAEDHGIFIPRFCYHPGMDPVAACRMCLVEVEGSRRPLDPACVTYVSDGMVVRTDSEAALGAQEGVLEMLLVNHPLDCPVCDRGGECPLQDQTLRYGPGGSRYSEGKRHFEKPVAISNLVLLDRERCVLCWRCTRFSQEIAGDPFIDLMDRGSLTQINTAKDKPYDSHFSGNVIQICPVGALTSVPYRFVSRPWDLEAAPSVCGYCAVGCPISIEKRQGRVVRAQALPNESVNSFWICDKGRFGQSYASHSDRLRAPLVRRDDRFEEESWDEALDLVANRLGEITPQEAGFIGGSHLLNEDLYAASKLMRDVVGTSNLDFRTFDAGFPYEHLLPGSTATIDDLDSARTILWFAADPREELPVLYLRLRRAVEKGARLVVCHPRRTSLTPLASLELRFVPGSSDALFEGLLFGGEDPGIGRAREWLDEGGAVVCCGPQFAGEPQTDAVAAAAQLTGTFEGTKTLICVPNANSQGAIDFGLLGAGLDTAGMLKAASARKLKFLWVAGADLVSDFPDSDLIEAALRSGCFLVVSELFPTDTARSASLVLPAAAMAEKEGSFTNLERRIQKVNPVAAPPGVARADWRIFDGVAAKLGVPFGWENAADVAEEISDRVPTHSEFSWGVLGEAPEPLPPAVRRSGGEWPLRWELRAVDATRRRGWVWPANGLAATPHRSSARGRGHEPADRDGLHLLVARGLFDAGSMVTRSPELAGSTPSGFVELHPAEAASRSLADGGRVVVTSPRGSVRALLRVSDDTPQGAAYMPLHQPGLRTNLLIDFGENATYVEVSR